MLILDTPQTPPLSTVGNKGGRVNRGMHTNLQANSYGSTRTHHIHTTHSRACVRTTSARIPGGRDSATRLHIKWSKLILLAGWCWRTIAPCEHAGSSTLGHLQRTHVRSNGRLLSHPLVTAQEPTWYIHNDMQRIQTLQHRKLQ